jgi:hypothetical protein
VSTRLLYLIFTRLLAWMVLPGPLVSLTECRLWCRAEALGAGARPTYG